MLGLGEALDVGAHHGDGRPAGHVAQMAVERPGVREGVRCVRRCVGVAVESQVGTDMAGGVTK